ncbi:MAG: hypothetical protein ACKOCD_10130, partial [Nitrospiraceae bacterium]
MGLPLVQRLKFADELRQCVGIFGKRRRHHQASQNVIRASKGVDSSKTLPPPQPAELMPGSQPHPAHPLTAGQPPVYQWTMATCRSRMLLPGLTLLLLSWPALVPAEELPLTRDLPIQEFQNKAETPSYNFDAPPGGIFRSILVAEGFDEELGFRRTHEIVPINPTEVFRPEAPSVFIVFTVFPHYQSYQVVGVCYPEQVDGLDPKVPVAKDSMYLALEDESGYLKLFPSAEHWKPGRYKVEIHIGWEVTEISLTGTMRFTVAQSAKPPSGEPNVSPR